MMRRLTFNLLTILIGCNCLLAQDIRITGIVIGSDDNEPIIGASVVVKGTTTGTVTDYKGSFNLNVARNATLVVSYVGMKTQEVAAQPNMRIVLESDAQQLDDVIVVAYGTAKRSSFTGSASTVGARDLEMRPISQVTSVLEGAVPGLQIAGGSGQPGESAKIRIRGFGSINASNDPLYVVDGAIYNGELSDINPNDIESITVLKDAASTSLYGSSAGNGVVLITTKSAKDNDTRITFNTSQGFSKRAIPEYDRVNVWNYYPLQWEQLKNSKISGGSSAADAAAAASAEIYDLLKYNPFKSVDNNSIVGVDGKLNPSATSLLYGDDLDWVSAMERLGYRSEYNLSYSTKTQKSDTYVSLGYLDEKSYIKTASLERVSGRMNVNVYPVKWLKTGLNLSASRSSGNIQTTESSTAYNNYFYFARNIGPIYPVYEHDPVTGEYIRDANGKKIYDYKNPRGAGASSGRHSIAENMLNERKYVRDAMNGRTYLDLNLFDGFKATVNAGLETGNHRYQTYENTEVGDGAGSGRFRNRNIRRTTTTFNQLLNYDKTFGDHHFEILAGHESYKFQYQFMDVFKIDQTVDGILELDNFITVSSTSGYSHEYNKEGYFFRANYDYADKYYVSASYRRDGSSRFSKDNRWGNFWSIGASWRIDQEAFMEGVTAVNSLKLRASYGQTGNDNVLYPTSVGFDDPYYGTNQDFYPYQTLYSLNNANSTEPGIWFDGYGNPDLKWETQSSTDVAIEFGLFDRLNGSVEYFMKESKDLLFDVPLPLSTGTFSIWKNVGKVVNKGVEVNLDYMAIKTRDWKWNVGVNATFLKNKVTKMADGMDEIIDGTKKISEGYSLYEFWLKEYMGVDPSDGKALYRLDEEQIWSDTDCWIVDEEEVTTNINKAKYHYAGS